MTFSEALLIQIAQDEELAREALVYGERPYGSPLAARFWGLRVLAECEAKRLIVAEHAESLGGGRCRICGDVDDEMVNQVYPCLTLRLMGAPYRVQNAS